MARRPDPKQPIYVISIAAELAGVHPQTLRIYERKGLVSPQRTAGNSRRYSERDIEILRRIQELTNEGINLAGVIRIMELEEELRILRSRHERARAQTESLEDRLQQEMDARSALSMVPVRDIRRIRRAMKSDLIDRMTAQRAIQAPPIGGAEERGE